MAANGSCISVTHRVQKPSRRQGSTLPKGRVKLSLNTSD
jgi:hypothetical protein